MVILAPCRKLLIGGHEWRCDIVRQQKGLRVDMKKLNDVVMTNNAASTCFRERLGGDNLPEVVRVIVSITGNLLPCCLVGYYRTLGATA